MTYLYWLSLEALQIIGTSLEARTSVELSRFSVAFWLLLVLWLIVLGYLQHTK